MIKGPRAGLNVVQVHKIGFDDSELLLIVSKIGFHPLNRIENGGGRFKHVR